MSEEQILDHRSPEEKLKALEEILNADPEIDRSVLETARNDLESVGAYLKNVEDVAAKHKLDKENQAQVEQEIKFGIN